MTHHAFYELCFTEFSMALEGPALDDLVSDLISSNHWLWMV